MAVFFTSDLHFGHQNILDSCGRPFADIDEMNAFLIDRWNQKVTDEDEVYLLGDISYRSKVPVRTYLQQLRGRKHLILGNHDWQWTKSIPDLGEFFESVDGLKIIRIENKLVTLCHYPMLEWNGSRRARNQDTAISWLIHGHIHNRKSDIYDYIREHQPCALNCGVDINHFEPVTFEELLKNNNRWYDRGTTGPDQV